MKRALLSLVLVAGLGAPTFAQDTAAAASTPATRQPDTQSPQARIEVVFVLDTTGSMSGLIEGAKQKIWSIANAMATAKPRPHIRIGLVGFRDRGDEYVTRLTPMTDDLDAVYADLMKFSAGGGGDTPESVNQALHEAYTKFDWTPNTGDGRNTLRLIYLVGDAPPHMDYTDDVKFEVTCRDAIKNGITINTIQCGGIAETTPVWKQIAAKTDGEFFAIEQSGGMRVVESPFDADLAKLGAELEATVVAYGSSSERARQTAKMDVAAVLSTAAAPAPARAERAAYKASEAGISSLCGTNDLVQACLDKTVDLTTLPEDQLPENMKKMTLDERKAHIAKLAEERKDRQQKIKELSAKREAFVKAELAKAPERKDSFDEKVLDSLTRQAARCGITYEKK
ncbi:MAG: VWA domain-containing protein [Phycisphaeraceae bacterium]|nr:VWA domain-containing protein [Phycisphaeraceae bacterium]